MTSDAIPASFEKNFSVHLFHATLNALQQGLILLDPDGRIIYWNDWMSKMSGLAGEEIFGKYLDQVFPQQADGRLTQAVQWVLKNGLPSFLSPALNRQCLPLLNEGRRIEQSIHVSPLALQLDQSCFLICINDVTASVEKERVLRTKAQQLKESIAMHERAEAELQLAHDAADSASRAKSVFLSNMSHELRTPLNAILGFSDILRRDAKLSESQQQTLAIIHKSGDHLLALINDALDIAKIEAGKMRIESHPFRLIAAIDDVVDMMVEHAGSKGLIMSVERAADVPKWTAGDFIRFKQILLNLLSNAIKFTERGQVTLKVTSEGELVFFQVSDTGIGMTEVQLAQLFQAFEQGDSSITRKYGGTGLGLAISRNLARLMGGDIMVTSQTGEGSTFSLSLPLPPVTPVLNAEPEDRVDKHRLAGLRVLAADDVDFNCVILEDMLTHEGAHVVIAHDGRQALERLEEAGVSAFDVVLMDVQMPVMDGQEATRRILAIAPGLPVIGFTARAMSEELDKCLAAGMVDHVTKPVNVDTLVEAILRQVRPETQLASTAPAAVSADAQKGSLLAGCNDPEIIDLGILSSEVGDDPAKIDKYATSFIEYAHDTLMEMDAALACEDMPTLGSLAHRLKSVAFTVGAMRFGEFCQELERLKDDNNLEAARAKVDQLHALFERIEQRVKHPVNE
jgi:PAS domain S-box-containing protein